MNRRRFLTAVSISLPAGGCLARLRPPGADQPNPESGTTTPRGDPESEVAIVIRNATSTEQSVSVTLTNDGATVLEREVTAVPNGESALETGIEQQGQYELRVAVESGSRKDSRFTIDEYDLREGSNLIVTITEDRVEIVIQE